MGLCLQEQREKRTTPNEEKGKEKLGAHAPLIEIYKHSCLRNKHVRDFLNRNELNLWVVCPVVLVNKLNFIFFINNTNRDIRILSSRKGCSWSLFAKTLVN